MKVIVTGATGFIGQALVRALLARGDQVVALTRNLRSAREKLGLEVEVLVWHPPETGPWTAAFNGADAVVNLAGAPINTIPFPWTERHKRRVLTSRLNATNAVVNALARANPRPAVLINASGMDYYAPQGATPITEAGAPGSGFLANVVREWETAARRAEPLGVRVVLIRTTLVLGKGGILPLLALPFRFFVGGWFGAPNQWFSWVHIEDEVGLILRALDYSEVRGAINAAAPNPVTNAVFARELGRVLHRPSWLPMPAPLMRLVLGEQAQIALGSRRLLPRAADEAGYTFRYPELGEALRSVLGT